MHTMKSLKSWGKKNRRIDFLEWLLCQKWPKTQNEKWDEHKISSKVRATEDFIEQFCAPPCAQFYWIFQSQLQNIARAPYLLPKIFSNEICSKFYLWRRAQLLPVSLGSIAVPGRVSTKLKNWPVIEKALSLSGEVGGI